MTTVRLRRLQSDFERITDLVRRHPRLTIVQTVGDPPDRYQINYRVRSLRKTGNDFLLIDDHLVEISLPSAFPRTPPLCRMLTPVFHPNIAPHAICIGDHWSPGETLSSLVIRIAEMLAFQSYNTRSPLNGEAAKWVEQNIGSLPLDPASMTLDEAPRPPVIPPRPTAPPPFPGSERANEGVSRATVPKAGSTATPSGPPSGTNAAAPASTVTRNIEFPCPACGATLRVPIGASAVRTRCPKCRELATVGPDGKVVR